MGLNIGDEGGEAGGPAAVGMAGPAAGCGGFAEGDESVELRGVVVFSHQGSVQYDPFEGFAAATIRYLNGLPITQWSTLRGSGRVL